MPQELTLTELQETEKNVSMSNTIARASHELKLGEKRLICAALASLDSIRTKKLVEAHTGLGFDACVTAADYAAHFNLDKSTVYTQLKEACDLLFERHIRHETMTAKGKVIHKVRWVSSAKYHEGEGWVQLRFTSEVAPHLLALRTNFTTYKLKHAAGLDTVYAWRLYELLTSWKSSGIYRVSIDEFHRVMEVPDSFKTNFSILRFNVIDPSLERINGRTDLIVQYQTIKNGRKIVRIDFSFIRDTEKVI